MINEGDDAGSRKRPASHRVWKRNRHYWEDGRQAIKGATGSALEATEENTME